MLAWQYGCVVEEVYLKLSSKIGARAMYSDIKVINMLAKVVNRNNRLAEVLIFTFLGQWNFHQRLTVFITELLLRFILLDG